MSQLIDSYGDGNANTFELFDEVNTKKGQSFTSTGGTLDNVTFLLRKSNNPTGNIIAEIYTHTGTYGTTNGKPTGTALATSDPIDSSTLSSSLSPVTFTFTGVNKISLPDAHYFVVVSYTDGIFDGNTIGIGLDTTSPTHSGRRCKWVAPSWFVQGNWDIPFSIYKD